MSADRTASLFARLKPEDKALFERAAKDASIPPAIAARMLIESAVNELRTRDMLDVLVDVRSALSERVR